MIEKKYDPSEPAIFRDYNTLKQQFLFVSWLLIISVFLSGFLYISLRDDFRGFCGEMTVLAEKSNAAINSFIRSSQRRNDCVE